MALDCTVARSNTGEAKCFEDLARHFKYVAVPDDFEIADIATAMIEDSWTAYFQSDTARAYPFPELVKVNALTQNEAVQEQLVAGQTEKVRDGNEMWDWGFKKGAVCNYRKLRTHDNTKPKIVIVDANKNIWATSSDLTKIEGIDTNQLNIKTLVQSDGEIGVRGGIKVEIKDVKQINDNLIIIKPIAFDPTDWTGLNDVALTEVTSSTSSITISVIDECDNTPAIGLVEGDFSVLDSGGSAVTVSTFTDNGDGTYTFDATFTAGTFTFNLVTPGNMTTTGYESTGAIEITTS